MMESEAVKHTADSSEEQSTKKDYIDLVLSQTSHHYVSEARLQYANLDYQVSGLLEEIKELKAKAKLVATLSDGVNASQAEEIGKLRALEEMLGSASFQDRLIQFLAFNEEKFLRMPTPDGIDIFNFIQGEIKRANP